LKPATFKYRRAGSLEQATAALADAGGDARLIAGGQTLGPMLNLRLAMPGVLIDISRVASLTRIEKTGTSRVIGACVTHATLEDRPADSVTAAFMRYVASNIAYRAVRNRGTIGGSLAHADPTADWVSTMLVLDAELDVAGPGGMRQVAMRDFMRGAFTTAIGPGEVLASIRIPELSPDAHWGYYRICRKVGDFPDAIGAVALDASRRSSRIVVGALDGAPLALPDLAAEVARSGLAAATLPLIKAAIQAASADLDSIALQLHAVAVQRALAQALPHD